MLLVSMHLVVLYPSDWKKDISKKGPTTLICPPPPDGSGWKSTTRREENPPLPSFVKIRQEVRKEKSKLWKKNLHWSGQMIAHLELSMIWNIF